MSDSPMSSFALPAPASAWLSPLSEEQPCGVNLEFEPEFLELEQAVSGKPESQFAPAKPPDWIAARQLAEALMDRTRDLRVAFWWSRACVNMDGFAAVPVALCVMQGLLDQFWDQLHHIPDADDEDCLARVSVIGGLDKANSLLGDIRNATLHADRTLDGMRVRDVEIALEKLAPRTGETPRSRTQVVGMLAAVPEVSEQIRLQTDSSMQALRQIQALLGEKLPPGTGIEVKTLNVMLHSIGSVLPERIEAPEPVADDAPEETSAPAAPATSKRVSGVHSIESRHDAVRAIELVCDYLERNEPTNPAQLFLRRAARAIDKNFLQLVNDLAPDAVKDVARILGVNPSDLGVDN